MNPIHWEQLSRVVSLGVWGAKKGNTMQCSSVSPLRVYYEPITSWSTISFNKIQHPALSSLWMMCPNVNFYGFKDSRCNFNFWTGWKESRKSTFVCTSVAVIIFLSLSIFMCKQIETNSTFQFMPKRAWNSPISSSANAAEVGSGRGTKTWNPQWLDWLRPEF